MFLTYDVFKGLRPPFTGYDKIIGHRLYMIEVKIAGVPRGTRRLLLPLLPSGPDGVHNPPLHGTRLLNLTAAAHVPSENRPLLVYVWRRERDSNPRYTFVGIHTISSRALRPLRHLSLIFFSGGERGIRTPVRAFGPQIDFESIPLRPLRYLSAYVLRPGTRAR